MSALMKIVGILGLGAIVGCGQSFAHRQELHYPIQVVCTTGQVADIVKNVGGGHLSVEVLMGPGADPHLYKATPDDRKKLNAADVVFYNGMHLEGRIADMLVAMARRKPTFAVTEQLAERGDKRLREPPEFEGHYDPHIWFNAELWADCAAYVAEQLIELDPAHKDDYRRNADAYIKELKTLHGWCQERLAEIPKEQRVLVTAHDAFGYFGDAYGIGVHGLQGISTADQTDISTVKKLAAMLAERHIKSVFVETSVPKRNVESLIAQCKSLGHELQIGGELYSDAMGVKDSPGETYVGMMKANVEMIVKALR